MMNTAFELSRHRDWRDDNPFQFNDDKPLSLEDFEPGKIVSLWDMLKFNADLFVNVCGILDEISRPLDPLIEGQSQGLSVGTDLDKPLNIFHSKLLEIRDALNAMGLLMSVITTDRLLEVTKKEYIEPPLVQIQQLMNDLKQRLTDELSTKWAFMILGNRGKYYAMRETFCGDDVKQKFPSLIRDAREAGSCFALGRYTACVYHLMRVMEVGLNALGNDLSVDVEENWHKMLNKIEKEIKRRNETPTQEWRQTKQRYTEAATHFRMVKDAWRNHTMHIRAFYNEDDALDILNSVRAFMRHLATWLQETDTRSILCFERTNPIVALDNRENSRSNADQSDVQQG